MEVYVVYNSDGILGVYDSLLGVKEDLYPLSDDWDTIQQYTEEETRTYFKKRDIYFSKEHVFTDNEVVAGVPIIQMPVIQML